MHHKHPDLPEDSPFAHPHPFEDWRIRKSKSMTLADVIVLAKDAEAALERLIAEHDAEPAAWKNDGEQTVYFRISDGRFAIIYRDEAILDQIPPLFDIWNWWDEASPDLATLREKTAIGLKISNLRYG